MLFLECGDIRDKFLLGESVLSLHELVLTLLLVHTLVLCLLPVEGSLELSSETVGKDLPLLKLHSLFHVLAHHLLVLSL